MKADDVSRSLKDLDTWTKDASSLGAKEISNITATLEDLFFFSFTDLEVSENQIIINFTSVKMSLRLVESFSERSPNHGIVFTTLHLEQKSVKYLSFYITCDMLSLQSSFKLE